MKAAAIFDWDGVVIDSSAQHERSWELLADEEGLPLEPDHFKKGFGKKNERIIPDLGWAEEPGEVDRLSHRKEALYRELVREQGVIVLPGVRELLEGLRAEEIGCAVGSSTHRANIELILSITGLEPFFSGLVTAEDVSHGKPDPEVFLKCADRLGARPEESVVFEDALVGIEAGHAAGMKVIAVATTNALSDLGYADLSVERLTSVTPRTLIDLIG